jgi:hypothetical protein
MIRRLIDDFRSRLVDEFIGFCIVLFISMSMMAFLVPSAKRAFPGFLMGAAAAGATATVVMARRRQRSMQDPTPSPPGPPPKCARRASWWPWSERCLYDWPHGGPCSFDVVRARRNANLALLESDPSTHVSSYATGNRCRLCDEHVRLIDTYKAEKIISPAGEEHTLKTIIFAGYVCLRCAEITNRGAHPRRVEGSIAWYLGQTPKEESSHLPEILLLQAIDQMAADIDKLRKLLPPKPYR